MGECLPEGPVGPPQAHFTSDTQTVGSVTQTSTVETLEFTVVCLCVRFMRCVVF